MLESLKHEGLKHCDQCRVLSFERIQDLKHDLETIKRQEDLNVFQKYILSDMYRFEPVATDFTARSIIVIATPIPSRAKVIVNWRGEKVPLVSLARSFIGKRAAPEATKRYLTKILKPNGYRIERAPRLPLKRLAARSGLAAYGRNNICYVEGMGSFLTLTAYFTDLPCGNDDWQEISSLDECGRCEACVRNCPTGAIRRGRFLIDNERCLSYFNEGAGDFPEWLPKAVHHCLYDCLSCQNACPKNANFLKNVIGPVEFDEEETRMLLLGRPMKDFPRAMKQKVRLLGMDEWLTAIPRNLKVLLEGWDEKKGLGR